MHPVAGLPLLSARAGACVAILTRAPTPLDEIAEVRLSGDVEVELGALAATLGCG